MINTEDALQRGIMILQKPTDQGANLGIGSWDHIPEIHGTLLGPTTLFSDLLKILLYRNIMNFQLLRGRWDIVFPIPTSLSGVIIMKEVSDQVLPDINIYQYMNNKTVIHPLIGAH